MLSYKCDILIPAALENAITQKNAELIECSIVACGSNGPCSSKAEQILNNRNITVLYDFLANGAGVTASYFEWLRNMNERFRYEAEEIRKEKYSMDIMDRYIMPEFNSRIKRILLEDEGKTTTNEWNLLLRDIIFSEVNEDFNFSIANSISMKSAGFVNSILRVLTATIINMKKDDRKTLWVTLSNRTKDMLKCFFDHPEAAQLADNIKEIKKELFT